MPKTTAAVEGLKVGQKAPAFSLPDDAGKTVSLADFKGKRVILYFYPKDDTPGCTLEACNFRDDISEFKKRGVVILGVSADSSASHRKFRDKYSLPFALLSDEELATVKAYGVWRQKSMYGRTYMGIERTTFVISETGVITHIFPKVRVSGHNQELLDALA